MQMLTKMILKTILIKTTVEMRSPGVSVGGVDA